MLLFLTAPTQFPNPSLARRRRFVRCSVSPSPTSSSSLPADLPDSTKFGFASLLGPSNSGKSTLLNRLVGSKVAIVTPKEQTTRCRVSGIALFCNTQVAFLDTPGIFDASQRFDRAMVKSAWTSGRDADAAAVIMDAAEMHHVARKRRIDTLHVSDGLELVIEGLVRRAQRAGDSQPQPSCFVANKIDAIPEDQHDHLLERAREALVTRGVQSPHVLPISARDGRGVDTFADWVVQHMPPGPWMYPKDYMTDMSSRLVASEVTREKLMLALRDELPYEIAVETTDWNTRPDGSIRIAQDILVRRDSQIGIVTGRGGSMVKKIGTAARTELGDVLGCTVHLIIRVKVRKWKDDVSSYTPWGLDFQA